MEDGRRKAREEETETRGIRDKRNEWRKGSGKENLTLL
jgi:hypothetical protein